MRPLVPDRVRNPALGQTCQPPFFNASARRASLNRSTSLSVPASPPGVCQQRHLCLLRALALTQNGTYADVLVCMGNLIGAVTWYRRQE